MLRTRFVVLQMKDIVRTGIFALIGLILLIVLIWAVLPDRPEGAAAHGGNFVPGTYTSYIILHNRPITVSVTVDEEKIVDITMSELGQVQEVFYPLIRPTMATLSERVIYSQSTNVQIPVEANMTGRILLDAIDAALMQALNQ